MTKPDRLQDVMIVGRRVVDRAVPSAFVRSQRAELFLAERCKRAY